MQQVSSTQPKLRKHGLVPATRRNRDASTGASP